MNVTDGVTIYGRLKDDHLQLEHYRSWDVTGTYDYYGDVAKGTTANGILVTGIALTLPIIQILLCQRVLKRQVLFSLPFRQTCCICDFKSTTVLEGLVEAYEVSE